MNGRWLASRSASQSKSRGSGDGGGEFGAAALSRRLNENRLARRLCYDALGCGSTSLLYGHSLRLIAGKVWLSLNSICYQVSRFRRLKDFFKKRFFKRKWNEGYKRHDARNIYPTDPCAGVGSGPPSKIPEADDWLRVFFLESFQFSTSSGEVLWRAPLISTTLDLSSLTRSSLTAGKKHWT